MQKRILYTALIGMVMAGMPALAEKGMGHGSMMPSFDEMDADKDGKISMDEFKAHRVQQMMAQDTNKDGQITAEEMAAAHMKKMQERMAQRIAKADTDKNGSLSEAEVQAMAAPEGKMAKYLKRVDADNDGSISRAEFDKAMEKMGKHHDGKGMDHDKPAE